MLVNALSEFVDRIELPPVLELHGCNEICLGALPRLLHPCQFFLNLGLVLLQRLNLEALVLILEGLVTVYLLQCLYLPFKQGLILSASFLNIAETFLNFIKDG